MQLIPYNFAVELEKYRLKLISFDQLASACKISRPRLTLYFRHYNILTNRDIKRNSITHNIFSDLNNELSSYLLGLYVADGSCSIVNTHTNSPSKMFSISLSEIDFSHLYKIQQIICPNHTLSKQGIKTNSNGSISKPMYTLSVSSEQMFDTLTTLGYGQRKTYLNMTLPKLDDEYLWHFIRGYFDGDGCVGTGRGYKRVDGSYYYNSFFSITAKTDALLLNISQFLLRHDIVSHIYYDPNKIVYTLSISSKHTLGKLRPMLYNNATWYLERKFIKFMAIPS